MNRYFTIKFLRGSQKVIADNETEARILAQARQIKLKMPFDVISVKEESGDNLVGYR